MIDILTQDCMTFVNGNTVRKVFVRKSSPHYKGTWELVIEIDNGENIIICKNGDKDIVTKVLVSIYKRGDKL